MRRRPNPELTPAIQADAQPATIGAFLDYLLPGLRQADLPAWPPDVFAIAAILLQKSGGYSLVSQDWPPRKNWVRDMEAAGRQWRRRWASQQPPPEKLRGWWRAVISRCDLDLADIPHNRAACLALLQLCAAADEACTGMGVPPDRRTPRQDPRREADDAAILREAYGCLQRPAKTGSTLCKSIHASKVRVLPKMHTPQNGLTIRSLSRSLALYTAEEIRADWKIALGAWDNQPPGRQPDNSLNLLIVPWPEVVRPLQFQPAGNIDDNFGFFTYIPDPNSVPDIGGILRRAQELAGPIHGVVLPELSMAEAQFEKIVKPVLNQGAFLIGGVAKRGAGEQPAGNCVRYCQALSRQHYIPFEQHKHHRWKLDKSQIIQYGIGSMLYPEKFWWERIPLGNRSLMFVSLHHWLTMCVLICEDLARPDPVGDLVRAVGPNLVIALLMDGPQLAERWPGRYATVLADDPGCSVLSLTSIGMVELSRPPNVTAGSRVVALWKDAKSRKPLEIELPKGADALVLSLTVQYIEEYTADGRSDHRTTGYPILAGVHPVFRSL
jgi:hypothetical protein